MNKGERAAQKQRKQSAAHHKLLITPIEGALFRGPAQITIEKELLYSFSAHRLHAE